MILVFNCLYCNNTFTETVYSLNSTKVFRCNKCGDTNLKQVKEEPSVNCYGYEEEKNG